MANVWIEATFVGILFLIIGLLVSFILKVIKPDIVPKLPQDCSKWNDNHVMEITLLLTGFVGHLLCECIGLNEWYCLNGNACRSTCKLNSKNVN
jgi:hypothetical protein